MIFRLEYTPLFLLFICFCPGFCALGKTATSPSLEGVAFIDESSYLNLPWLLVASQTFVTVQAAYFIFS